MAYSKLNKDMQVAMTDMVDIKAKRYAKLKEEILNLGIELKEDLKKMDRLKFDGMTWYEYLRTIDEEIEVDETFKIRRDSYRVDGKMLINNKVEITLQGTIYSGDTRFRELVVYLESGRTLDSIPAKYTKQKEAMIEEMSKYKVERPADRYIKELGLSDI